MLPAVTDGHLLSWHFEDWLKKYFFSILQILEVCRNIRARDLHFVEILIQTLCLDPVSYVRTQALTLIFTLLRDKPEQEQNLLRLLVNKLVSLVFFLFPNPILTMHSGRH
jgi:ribosome biogenesis protein MAK21